MNYYFEVSKKNSEFATPSDSGDTSGPIELLATLTGIARQSPNAEARVDVLSGVKVVGKIDDVIGYFRKALQETECESRHVPERLKKLGDIPCEATPVTAEEVEGSITRGIGQRHVREKETND